MSTDITRRASFNGGARTGSALPRPAISASAERQDKLDDDQFEKQARDFLAPTLARPALIVADEVEKIRAQYGTGAGRLNVLVAVTSKRLDYWTEQSGGGTPFDPISDTDRAKCGAFFQAHGVRLAGGSGSRTNLPSQVPSQRQAPPNPLRRETPVAPPAPVTPPAAVESHPRAEPGAGPLQTTERLPDSVGGAVRGGLAVPPPATFEIECVLDGFPCKLTLHALTGVAVLDQGQAAIKKLKDQKATPPVAPAVAASAPAAKGESAGEETPLCAIHHTPMAKRQGKNGSFWSCPQKLEDGSWCPYRPK